MAQANTGIAYGNLFKYIQMIISDCQNSPNNVCKVNYLKMVMKSNITPWLYSKVNGNDKRHEIPCTPCFVWNPKITYNVGNCGNINRLLCNFFCFMAFSPHKSHIINVTHTSLPSQDFCDDCMLSQRKLGVDLKCISLKTRKTNSLCITKLHNHQLGTQRSLDFFSLMNCMVFI